MTAGSIDSAVDIAVGLCEGDLLLNAACPDPAFVGLLKAAEPGRPGHSGPTGPNPVVTSSTFSGSRLVGRAGVAQKVPEEPPAVGVHDSLGQLRELKEEEVPGLPELAGVSQSVR